MFFILSASECVLTPSRARCIPMQAQTTIKSIFSSNLILEGIARGYPTSCNFREWLHGEPDRFGEKSCH